MIVETTTFRLTGGASEGDFLAADRAVQQEFAHQQPGFVRRTTARSDEGAWLVVTLWGSQDDAAGAAARAEGDPACQRFRALIDEGTLDVRRYTDLDG